MTRDEFFEDTGVAMGIVGGIIARTNPLSAIALIAVPKLIDLMRTVSHQTGASHQQVVDVINATIEHTMSLPSGLSDAPGALGEALRKQGSA